MTKLTFLIISSLIALTSFLFVNNNKDKELDLTKLALENSEALANSESETDHYWCCGNTDTCASGPGYEIKGKLQDKPCK